MNDKLRDWLTYTLGNDAPEARAAFDRAFFTEQTGVVDPSPFRLYHLALDHDLRLPKIESFLMSVRADIETKAGTIAGDVDDRIRLEHQVVKAHHPWLWTLLSPCRDMRDILPQRPNRGCFAELSARLGPETAGFYMERLAEGLADRLHTSEWDDCEVSLTDAKAHYGRLIESGLAVAGRDVPIERLFDHVASSMLKAFYKEATGQVITATKKSGKLQAAVAQCPGALDLADDQLVLREFVYAVAPKNVPEATVDAAMDYVEYMSDLIEWALDFMQHVDSVDRCFVDQIFTASSEIINADECCDDCRTHRGRRERPPFHPGCCCTYEEQDPFAGGSNAQGRRSSNW